MKQRIAIVAGCLLSVMALKVWLFTEHGNTLEEATPSIIVQQAGPINKYAQQPELQIDAPTVVTHNHLTHQENTQASYDFEHDIQLPPIVKSKPLPNYSGDLDDHEAYRAFYTKQDVQLKQAFIKASEVKLNKLKELLEKGRSAGVSQQQLAFAEEKIAGIQAMKNKLEQELSSAHF